MILPLLVSVQSVVYHLLSLLKVSEMHGHGRVIVNGSLEVLFRWQHVVICRWCMERIQSTSVVRIYIHRK